MRATAQRRAFSDDGGHLAAADDLARRLERDGFVVVPDFFSLDEVEAARAECVDLLDVDLRMRETRQCQRADWAEGPTPGSSLTDVMHTVLFPILHCPVLARMIDRIISSSVGSALIRRAVGEDYRLRVDLARRSRDVRDVGHDGDLPHAWHRDRPGEFTCGIFFDDLTSPGSSETAVVPGTHMLPFSPMWDFMLSRPCYRSRTAYLDGEYRYMLDWFFRHNLFQGFVRAFFTRNASGMRGKKGDWYIFFNDVWHGRQPNLHGGRLVTVRFGGFASEFDFPEDIPAPRVPLHVPETLRRRYQPGQPRNTSKDSILQRMVSRQAGRQLNVFALAHAEKRLSAALSRRMLERRPALNDERYLATPK
jgi:hypothetical protein